MKLLKKIDGVVALLFVSFIVLIIFFIYLLSINKEIQGYSAIDDKIVHLELKDKNFYSFSQTIGIFKDYDTLNNDINTFRKNLEKLKEATIRQYPKNETISKNILEIQKAFEYKVDDLEYFKSLNSTLLNTTHFLFDLQATLRENPNISAEIKNSVNETLFYLLKFTTTDYIEDTWLTKQLEQIYRFAKDKDNPLIENFYIHARLMLTTVSELKKLSLQLQKTTLYDKLQTIHNMMDAIYTNNLQTKKEISILFFLSALLLLFTLFRVYRNSIKISQELYAFQFAVKHSDNTIVLTDPQRHITFVNKVFEKTTGYSKQEALGKNPNILKSGEQDENFYIELNKKLDRGEKWEGEFINKKKDGSLYYEKASIVPVFLDEKLISYLAIKLDITNYVKQNQKLELAASVFENTEEAIIIADADKKAISLNSAFSKIYGYSRQEVEGQSLALLQSGAQDTHFYKQMWNSIETKGVWQGKIINKTKSGLKIPIWSTIKAIKDKDDNVVNYIAVQNDLREIESVQEKIDYLAYHDQLTGLFNRAHFEEYLEHALLIAKRKQEKIALLFIDLDRFKIINDTLGHDIGDKVLIEVAKRLKQTLRESDFISRWGGDEFVVILENTLTTANSAKIASHLLNVLKEPIKVNSHILTITASIGIALYPENGDNSSSLIKHADSAMYLAKDTGKNQFQYYTKSLSKEIQSKLDIDIALRNALVEKEFYLLFQPQYNLKTKSLVSLEALIRWKNQNQELIYPDRFIPVAEENGLIVDIGYFVFEESCKALKSMRKNGLDVHYIAVNVASMQFKEIDLLNIFLSLLVKYNLQPSDIEIEITERFVMEPTFENMRLLQSFRDKGFRISIDDFGTGYSSMAYLKNLPADTIKIDKTFVDDIEKENSDDVIIKAILALTKTLGYSVVAEGIERVEEEKFLQENGCDYGQGYLFSRPISCEQVIERFVTNYNPKTS